MLDDVADAPAALIVMGSPVSKGVLLKLSLDGPTNSRASSETIVSPSYPGELERAGYVSAGMDLEIRHRFVQGPRSRDIVGRFVRGVVVKQKPTVRSGPA